MTGSHTFTSPGTYTVSIVVDDGDGGSANLVATTYIVVYDPNAGFVTGGGFINSPAGALVGSAVSGRANFGFVSKYQKGATTPTGQTEFNFQVANFNFHSSTYDWLVVSGARAQYKGKGTVNGQPGYSFLLTATDGQVSGGGGIDRFRIKIWTVTANGIETIVYDNAPGSDDLDTSNTQTIGGGSIMIKSK